MAYAVFMLFIANNMLVNLSPDAFQYKMAVDDVRHVHARFHAAGGRHLVTGGGTARRSRSRRASGQTHSSRGGRGTTEGATTGTVEEWEE
jgi:hypothetical protein